MAIFKTEQITASNLLEAVKELNQAFWDDHKSIQTLQKELAARDEKLLGEIHKLGKKVDQGFSELNETVNTGFQEMTNRFDITMKEQTDLLKQIAKNTEKD